MTPKPSFPDFGDFGPCRGRTLSQNQGLFIAERRESLRLNSWPPGNYKSTAGCLDCLQQERGLGQEKDPGKNYKPPPPLPPFARKEFLGGAYILKPPRQEFYTPPLFYTLPTPRRVFSGVGGWGCIKIGPVKETIRQIPTLSINSVFEGCPQI